MLVFLHHHLESWHQYSPRDNSRSKLVEHMRVNILVSDSFVSSLLDITVVKGKRLLSGFRLCDTRLFVLLSSKSVLFLKLFIKRLGGCAGDVVCFETDGGLLELAKLLLVGVLLKTLFSD